jgi:hypothetical protein|tara:strand:- start:1899 stop:2153 length:255 start_codon:yes stop_codon:yes gene_type:complete
MAKRLTEEEALQLHSKYRVPQWRYPWDEWLDGSWWLIERGKDYHIKTKSMRKLIYDKRRKAADGSRGVTTHALTEDTILFKRRT